ncbi:MAG: VOC family protein [Dyella sp.]|nr:VOC family protein [Dyella sp.]
MLPVPSTEDDVRLRSNEALHEEIVLREAPQAGLSGLAFSVPTRDALLALAERLQQAGVELEAPPARSQTPGEDWASAVRDPDGNLVQLIVPMAIPGVQPLCGRGMGPHRLGHVVLWTPQQEHMEDFYALLGLHVTDRTHLGMSFLRCNSAHHTLALARSKQGRTGLQHAAFDVGTVDQVMRERGRLDRAGIQCIWGVGRHGPGNNVFSYYRDPAGHVIEYYGEMEEWPLAPAGEPRLWGPEHKGDIWEVAGPAPEPFRD